MGKTGHKEPPKALVLEIQRMSTEDGPGIRTTVFFKGCSLNCLWCHNPESISSKPQTHWLSSRCIGCRTCIDACPNGALTALAEGIKINRMVCQSCGTCAEECPATAMELLGKEWTLAELTNEVVKDQAYFEKSGGGITVSGGEPCLQPNFVEAFLRGLREKGLHTALDTCGLCSIEALDRLLPHTSMVLYDIKEIDSEKHKAFTGSGNEKILSNLLHVADYMKSHLYPDKLWIRTPIIPNTTADPDNIRGIGKFIAAHLEGVVDRWELCAFNNLCKDKYIRLDKDWDFNNSPLLTTEFMEYLTDIAGTSGLDPSLIHWSGATRIEKEDTHPENEDQGPHLATDAVRH